LRNVLQGLKRRVFWVFARSCFAVYRRVPVFGALRASIAIIRRGDRFLAIHRNDGRGISLPGGISKWRETQEETLRREIREETGLAVTGLELKRKYYSDAELPCNIWVYEVQTSGEAKDSWEGLAQWATVEELEAGLMQSQRALLEVMKGMAERGQGLGDRG
jgi:8-oxo-dGTP pyrophosphatase MutT (NUDIX family)